jgi:hypothetical protein
MRGMWMIVPSSIWPAKLGQALSERVAADRHGICSRAAALFAELRYLFPDLYAHA